LYVAVLYEGAVTRPSWSGRLSSFAASPAAAIREHLSVRTVTTVLADQLTRAVAHLHQKAEAFAIQIADTVRPTLLAKGDAFRVLRRLVNYTPHKADGVALKCDTISISISATRRWNAIATICASTTTTSRSHDEGAPGQTFAHVLQDLYGAERVRGVPRMAAPPERHHATRLMRAAGTLQQEVSLVNYLSSTRNRRDARRRLGDGDRQRVGAELDRHGSAWALLRPMLVDGRVV
jgi:hypothetical protein